MSRDTLEILSPKKNSFRLEAAVWGLLAGVPLLSRKSLSRCAPPNTHSIGTVPLPWGKALSLQELPDTLSPPVIVYAVKLGLAGQECILAGLRLVIITTCSSQGRRPEADGCVGCLTRESVLCPKLHG